MTYPISFLSIHVLKVLPSSQKWSLFLNMTYEYMLETWPEKLFEKENFISNYDTKLQSHLKQENRGLFLYFLEKTPVGLSNVFLDKKEGKTILNIAEFFVASSFRKRKIGSYILKYLTEWGKLKGARYISVEVDKHLETANYFWSSFGYTPDFLGARNLFFSKIL